MSAMFPQSVYGRMRVYEARNDSDRSRFNRTIRHLVCGRSIDISTAPSSEMGPFQTEMLLQTINLKL